MSLGKEWAEEWFSPLLQDTLADFLDKKIAELRIKDAAKFMSEELKFQETIKKYFEEKNERIKQ
jgi:hypothetical protein